MKTLSHWFVVKRWKKRDDEDLMREICDGWRNSADFWGGLKEANQRKEGPKSQGWVSVKAGMA